MNDAASVGIDVPAGAGVRMSLEEVDTAVRRFHQRRACKIIVDSI